MLIFKLTVLESLVLLLNSPGHLRVGMTSAHQAGILELRFKEKSRGLKSSQEKGSSDNWKGRGICKEPKGPIWDWTGQRERLWRWTLEDGENELGTELTAPRECKAKEGHPVEQDLS